MKIVGYGSEKSKNSKNLKFSKSGVNDILKKTFYLSLVYFYLIHCVCNYLVLCCYYYREVLYLGNCIVTRR